MGLLSELRQSPESFAAVAEPAAESAKAPTYRLHPVSPPVVMRLGCEEWLPPACRGLEFYFPAEDWRLPVDPVDVPAAAPQPARREVAEAICSCGCPLWWTAIGDEETSRCAQCEPPPSKRMVEDFWLAEADGWERCVSDDEKWIRIGFAHLAAAEEQQREANAAKIAQENEGF